MNVHEKLLAESLADLGPALVRAFGRLTKLQGQDGILKLLRRIAG